jgi:hypothetical protein
VEALGDRHPHALHDVVGIGHDLVEVEAQGGVAEEREPRIRAEVAATILRRRVVREPVELDRQTVPDQAVQRMAVDPDLLSHADAGLAHQVEEPRLDARVRQLGGEARERRGARAAPRHADEMLGLDEVRAQR